MELNSPDQGSRQGHLSHIMNRKDTKSQRGGEGGERRLKGGGVGQRGGGRENRKGKGRKEERKLDMVV